MTTNRDQIYAGLIGKSDFLSFSYPRKVLCSYNKCEPYGHDLINNVTYPIYASMKERGYFMSNLLFLGSILESLGYPEVLGDEHIKRIMNEDFQHIFIEQDIMKDLYAYSIENFQTFSYKNDLDYFKNEFNLCEAEIKMLKKMNKGHQKQKRRF